MRGKSSRRLKRAEHPPCSLFHPVFAFKSFHAPTGIDKFLLPREKGMALGTDLHAQVFHGRSGFKGLPAGAGYLCPKVAGVNFFFH
jgi:hypothetical protein